MVENDRAGQRLAGSGDTEEQRQAVVHHRALFDELLEETTDRPLSRDTDTAATRDEEAVR